MSRSEFRRHTPWVRWYVGTSEDGKFRLVTRNAGVTVTTVIALWAALLEDAAHVEHRGVVTKPLDYFAAVLDLDPSQVAAVVAAMEAAGMVSRDADAIRITHWAERQYETDTRDSTNAERQRRFRERRKGNGTVTGGNVTRNVTGNGTVTAAKRPDTDTDTDTEKDCSTTCRVAARAAPSRENEQGLDFRFARGGRAEAAYHDGVKRAEGFGLPVLEIEAATKRARPRDPAAYFRSLCVNRLASQLPDVRRELLAEAMQGKAAAYTLVCAAMMGAAQ